MKIKNLLVWSSFLFAFSGVMKAESTTFLNSSYDVTREFYRGVNEEFVKHYKQKHGKDLEIHQSHGGSSKQARAVLDGLEADVVSFNQSTDIDILVPSGLVSKDWRSKFPHQASPYTSTILFLVKKGNPKGIQDWDDLVKPGVEVIIPNPKTSGNGRYSYIGAWGYALKHHSQDEAAARDFVGKLFANVPVLDTGGRGATNSFTKNGLGDVLLTFENEVHLILSEFKDQFEVIVPSLSVLADAPVAVVEPVAQKRGTTELVHEYLNFLFTEEVQEIAAQQNFRPVVPSVLAKHDARFPKLELITVDQVAGGWPKAQAKHFDDGGVFDQIYGN